MRRHPDKLRRYYFRKLGSPDPKLVIDFDLPKIDTFYQPAYHTLECLRGIL